MPVYGFNKALGIMDRQGAPAPAMNARDPGSILAAMLGVAPDVNAAYDTGYAASGSVGGAGASGGGFGSPGGFGVSSSTSRKQGESIGTRGQEAKISSLGAYANSLMPQLFRQERFDEVFPFLKGQFSSGQNQNFQSPQGPNVDVGPVWTPQQVQQQVNAARGSARQQTEGNIRGAQESVAGRGMASSSPLLQELEGMYRGQGLAQEQAAQREIPWNAAQGNAQQVTRAQALAEEAFANRQREEIERRRAANQLQSALLAAIAGIV